MIKKSICYPLRIFQDERCRELDRLYDVKTCSESYIQQSIGQIEYEEGAFRFLSLSKLCGSFVGISEKSLDQLSKLDENWNYALGLDDCFIRESSIEKERVYFPTEELLNNQRIKKKELNKDKIVN